ncbi:MAG: serine/threonine protein kinase [Deltaproteobacteria bacterium]|nr:serine/threonine protein kinase [Deltaproteobacteria bacterium]
MSRGPTTELTPSPSLDLLREVARAGGDEDRGPDLVGSRVGRYEVLRVLGSGGMGVVYAAKDTTLDRTVALKLMRGEQMHDPERRKRFLLEAKLASSVNHPNVATVYDAGVEEGVGAFIAMELCDGENLRRRAARGALAPAEIARIGIEIARGLAAAHARGVIHRDLKPDNVMVGPDGRVKVLDFGVAKSLARAEPEAALDAARAPHTDANAAVTVEGHVLGTPTYMSPEQSRGEAVDARSDVFSLGVVLDELARRSHERGEKRRVPAPLARVIARCLEPSPSLRFASADDVARALGDAARPRRRWLLVAAGVVTASIVAAILASPLRGGARAPSEATREGAAISAAPPSEVSLPPAATATVTSSPSASSPSAAAPVMVAPSMATSAPRPITSARPRAGVEPSPRASVVPAASAAAPRRAPDPLEDQK